MTCANTQRGCVLFSAILIGVMAAANAKAALPPVPTPPQNLPTEAKRILGKILFWDEQLSSDNTMACGTCHIPSQGGTDPRVGRHPGPDGILNTPDDKLGSFGVMRMDANLDPIDDPIFGFDMQVTERTAPSMINAAYAANGMFWDGRASGTFVDPETNTVSIPNGGALESQAVGPILSDVEMANEGRTWDDVRNKLNSVKPLELARNLPPDMAAAILNGELYGDLFEDAYGDPAITAERIAYAIATYQRTLISDETPWDAFDEGNVNALTPAQQQGLNTFITGGRCAVCHGGQVFSNQAFRNIGVRPIPEDEGRFEVTNAPPDRGRFKVPSLRNVGLKNRFMHNGQQMTLTEVVNFYRTPALQFPQNIDPNMALINIPPNQVANLVDFLQNGLTDPRVANETFPFDRPQLYSELSIGDVNCDGAIDGRDAQALTLALTDQVMFKATYVGCTPFAGDVNRDGVLDVDDVEALVDRLLDN